MATKTSSRKTSKASSKKVVKPTAKSTSKKPASKSSPPKPATKSPVKAKTPAAKKAAPVKKAPPKAKAVKSSPSKSAPTRVVTAKPAAPVKAAQKMLNYFGLSAHHSQSENAHAVVIPCPYEGTDQDGSSNGPRAILEASQQIELFDDELWTEVHKIGIHSHKEVMIDPVNADTPSPFLELHDVVKPLVEFGKFPIILGGDRAVSLGAVRACAERHPNLSVLQIGAHSGCRKTLAGNPYTHASVSYHLYKRELKEPTITQVGVSNISAEEVAWMEHDKPSINIYWARQQDRWNFQDIVNTLSNNVYLSIDVSGLDDSIMPSAAHPEPGGMTWYQLTELIKVLCIKKNVVAADIVGLAPIKGLRAPDHLCAKLLYKIIGYRFALDLGVTKKYL